MRQLPVPIESPQGVWSRRVLARFRSVTGLEAFQPIARGLPSEFLSRQAPSPADLVARLDLGRRTSNTLRRYLARTRDDCSEWTYARLMAIPGFGLAGLVDALEALATGGPAVHAPASRTLNEELAQLPSVQRGPRSARSLPLLDQAMDMIAGMLPASENQVQRRLRHEGLMGEPLGLDAIEQAARFSAGRAPFVVLRRRRWVVAVSTQDRRLAEVICALTIRTMTTRGIGTVKELNARTVRDSGFLIRLLRAHDDFQLLDRRRGWFWFRDLSSRLVRTLEATVAVHGDSPLPDLARAIFGRRPPAQQPPWRVLGRLCRQLPQFVVQDQTVCLARHQGGA